MKRPTYANVAATLALVVALGGTAYAAGLPKNSVGTPQLKKNAVTSAKVKKDAVTSPKIKPGAVGVSDLSAQALALAASGPASPALVSGAVSSIDSAGAGASIGRLGSPFSARPQTIALDTVMTLSPDVALTARHLSVQIRNDVPAGGSVIVTLAQRATVATIPQAVVTCTITGTADTTETACTSGGSGAIPKGALLNMEVTVNGGTSAPTNPLAVYWGFTVEPAAS